ncbi:MAG: hypothetical protein JNL96_20375, partial [Planctomycetaceae bacterium]|nr:hypothetical protein [Planctomycetaceae bacterium]
MAIVILPTSTWRNSVEVAAADGTWQQATGGPFNWNDPANWLLNFVPKNIGDRALLNAINLTADQTIQIDTSVFLASLQIGDTVGTNSYNLVNGGGSLTFDGRGTTTSLVKSGAGHDFIGANITLNDNLALDILGTGALTISGAISSSGAKGIVVNTAPGSYLELSGNNSFFGGLTLASGRLRAVGNANALGSGTGALNLTGGGTVLELVSDTALNFGRDTAISGNTNIVLDRLTPGAGVTYTLGQLTIANQTLSVTAGANVTGGTAGLTFGAVNVAGGPAVISVANPTAGTTLLTFGAMTNGAFGLTLNGDGNFAQTGPLGGGAGSITFAGTGNLSLNQANTFTGALIVSSGTVTATSNAAALGAGTLVMNGGQLLLTNASGTNLSFNRNTTISSPTSIMSDVASSGAGNTYTLGTLRMGSSTLTVLGGGNVVSGVAGLTFGATALTTDATFDVRNPSAGVTTLTLGALTDLGTARVLNLLNNAAGTSNVTLGTAATSLTDGTVVNVTGGAGGVNLALNAAGALGSLAQVNLASGGTLTLG